MKRKIFKYKIVSNHGKRLRAEWLGELGMTKEYATMVKLFW